MTAFNSAGGGLLLSNQSNEGGSAARESGDVSPHSKAKALTSVAARTNGAAV